MDTGGKAFYCYPPEGRRAAGTRRRHVHRSRWAAILTDIQFWVPVVVLALGAGLLFSLQ